MSNGAAGGPAADRPDRMAFTLRELSGGLGDLGTFLPLALAVALVGGLDLGVVFVAAGAMNVVTGLAFRQPIPVQPMKTIAAVVVADGLSGGAIAAAGLFVGAAVLLLAVTGVIDRAARAIPRPLVRGLQLGVGLNLALQGAAWVAPLPAFALDGLVLAGATAFVLGLLARRFSAVLPLVVMAGFAIAAASASLPAGAFGPPAAALVVPDAAAWRTGILEAGVPQLPLTLLNSVVAVCALSADLYPGRGVPAGRMAASVGLMNLACVPFGAMPMCHGAGGLAAQHRFGARTGGSVIMLGAMKIAAGLLLGGMLAALLDAWPRSILGVLVIFAGLALASAARDVRGRDSVAITLATAVGIVVLGTLEGVVGGTLTWALVAGPDAIRARRGGDSTD